MSFIQLNNIVKTFNDSQQQTETLAIDDISLSFEKKEFACLLGPSGCGKSTLLNMVAGFEYPTLGSVKIENKVITGPGATLLTRTSGARAKDSDFVKAMAAPFDVTYAIELP